MTIRNVSDSLVLTRSDSVCHGVIAMNSELQKRLKALAADLDGPLGPRPLDQVLRRHLDLFEELRRGGAQWSQIAHAIAAAGVRRADGGTVSADHLRGTISRLSKRQLRPHPPSPETVAEPPAKRSSRSASFPARPTGGASVPLPKVRNTTKKTAISMPESSQHTGLASIHGKLSRVARLRRL